MSQQHKLVMSKLDEQLLLDVHIYTYKQTYDGFEEINEDDLDILLKAYYKYFEIKDRLLLPGLIPFQNKAFSEIISLGLNKFGLLLNPRQALAFGLISSYIKERSKILHEKEGELGVATSLYLALGVSRLFNFNSILTSWNYHTKTIRDSLASYFGTRKFNLNKVYVEAVVPYKTLPWIFEPDINKGGETRGGLLPVLNELCEILEDKEHNIRVYLGDALELSKYFNKSSINIIHVDPPYYDVHIYSDVSELSWNILKTILEPVLNDLFKNNNLLHDWTPDKNTVPRTSELIASSNTKSEKNRFIILFNKFLSEAYEVLNDDGILVLWFSHKEWETWNNVVKALRNSGFSVIKVYPIVSEHPSRLITRGGIKGFNRALIIIAKKYNKCEALSIDKLKDEIDKIVKEMKENLERAKILPTSKPTKEEFQLFIKAAILTLITRVKNEDLKEAEQVIKEKMRRIEALSG